MVLCWWNDTEAMKQIQYWRFDINPITWNSSDSLVRERPKIRLTQLNFEKNK